MTVPEIKEEKEKSELAIKKILIDFQIKTGLQITELRAGLLKFPTDTKIFIKTKNPFNYE